MRSEASATIAPRDLSREPGAFTDERACRTVQAPRALRLGGSRVTLASGNPATPLAPLTIRAAATVAASVDGRILDRGRTVVLTPRALGATRTAVTRCG